MAPDPYQTLGVSPSATDAELRAAFRRQAQRHHPDHNQGSAESARRFAEVQTAYVQIRALRATDAAPRATAGDESIEARLAAMERELAAARETRERVMREAQRAARRRAAEQQAARAAERESGRGGQRASDEELGYIRTDDSFTKILDDLADEVAARFSEPRGAPSPGDAPTASSPPRRPRSVADWIDELGSRLTGEGPGTKR